MSCRFRNNSSDFEDLIFSRRIKHVDNLDHRKQIHDIMTSAYSMEKNLQNSS